MYRDRDDPHAERRICQWLNTTVSRNRGGRTACAPAQPRMDRTRERITRAAVDLHGTIGPAATTMSAVAERAGVTRATLYRHFPNEAALFTACSADWLAANPRPDLARWAAIADPARRLGTALDELYAYYRSTERMRTNLLRDIAVIPATFRPGIAAFPTATVAGPRGRLAGTGQGRTCAAQPSGMRSGSRRGDHWPGRDLTDAEAAELMVRFVIGGVVGVGDRASHLRRPRRGGP